MDKQKELTVHISRQALERMPYYINSLKQLKSAGDETVSAPTIAKTLELNEVQVRKDFAAVSSSMGKPKVGFEIDSLIEDMEKCLGYGNVREAVLVGAGSLGQALLAYQGFERYGLSIVMGFDKDEQKTTLAGKPIYPVTQLSDLCQRMKIQIGIITVPEAQAQAACDALIAGGIQAIWNFAPVHLVVPENILVQNENMAASLAVLSKHLQSKGANS